MQWRFLLREKKGFQLLNTQKFIASKSLLCRTCSYFDQTLKPDMATGGTEYHDFPKEEEKILELWKKLDAFKACLRQSKDRPRFESYDLTFFYKVLNFLLESSPERNDFELVSV